MNELKNKQIEFNNQKQNLISSSPDYIVSNNFGEYDHPFQNTMIDVTQNTFKSQIVPDLFNNESNQNLNQNITKKSSNINNLNQNNQNNNIPNNDYNINFSKQMNNKENPKSIIENYSMINKDDSLNNNNFSNKDIYKSDNYIYDQGEILNNVNISQQNYFSEIRNNFNDANLKNQNFNSSVPIQEINSLYNFP